MGRTLDEQTQQEKRDLVDQMNQKKNGMLDKDWCEIRADFDLDITAETLRKAGVGIKLASDACVLGNDDSPTINTISNGYVDRQKIRDLTNKANSVYRSASRSELLRETVAQAIKLLPEINIDYELPRHIGLQTDRSQVLTLADFHYGAETKLEGLLGETLNAYNSDIFEKRMSVQLSEVIGIIRKEQLTQVSVLLLGDLLDGMLRQSQLMRLEYGLVESTMKLSEYLAQWIKELSQYASVDVHAVSGNHSEVRPLKSKAGEFADENLERVILWFVAERLKNIPNVAVDPDCKKRKLVSIEGYSFFLVHGDGEKNISQLACDAVNLYSKPIDFFVCGHKHSLNEFPAGVTPDGNSIIIRTPSICGADHYANSKYYGGKAGAIATVIERGYGRRCVYPIQL